MNRIYNKITENTIDNVFNLPPHVQQQLNETVFKKIIKQLIIQTTPPIIPNVTPKTDNFSIDDDEFDSFKKPEPTTINIGQPKNENHNDLVMISDDDKAKIWRSLIKTDIEIRNKSNLKLKKKKKQKTTQKTNNKTKPTRRSWFCF